MAVNYGQVAIVPKGEWNVETQYKVNNLVSYDGSSYVAKVQPPVGTLPTDTSYWQVSAAGTKKATADSLGTVMPDGTTTSVGEDGKLSVNTAQQNALGVVKGSDDITVGEDGTLAVNTTFEQATELANIIAGEAIKSVLGKVSKAIATAMSLDENALLKNMISGIDVNDSNKVPSSAYIHTLVERIGMGTELVSGLGNLTTGLNTVNNNLSKCLQYIHSETDVFDFNDPKTPAGYHRLGAAASYKNAPSGLDGVNFCTVEIVRPTISDTLAMTIYPYKKGINPPVWYKSGGSNEWSTLPWNVYATKSDLNSALIYRGDITGDLNRASKNGITPGYYTVGNSSTISNGPKGIAWCPFIQFYDNFHTQMIIDTTGLFVRKFAGNPAAWIDWAQYSKS